MTVTPEIIQSAYRESNLVAIGKEPSPAQTTEALKRLNVLISGVYGFEVGDPFFDWPVGTENVIPVVNASWTPNSWSYLLPQARVIANAASAQTLYFPPEPDDGARVALLDPGNRLATYPITLEGNGRMIEGATSRLVDTDGVNITWFYRADLGDWVLLSELTGAAEEAFPFPPEFDDFFITRLAMRLNPRYGRSMSEETATELAMVLRKLRARYRQTQIIPADYGVLALTSPFQAGPSPIVRGRMGWMN